MIPGQLAAALLLIPALAAGPVPADNPHGPERVKEKEPAKPAAAGRTGAPPITVAELAAGLRKEGFQWKFVGREITFEATVLEPGPTPKVRITGLDEGRVDTAVLHNVPADNRLKAGDAVRVTGLIADQWYGVWQVWPHELRPAAR
jgi:hypothetical protein